MFLIAAASRLRCRRTVLAFGATTVPALRPTPVKLRQWEGVLC